MESLFRFSGSLYQTTFKATSDIVEKAVNEESCIPGCPFPGHFETLLSLGRYPDWLKFPVVFRYYEGKKIRDIIETGWSGCFLISDRMKELLEQEQLTGWKTYPILLFDKLGNEMPGYHGFSFIGYGGYYEYPADTPIGKINSLPITDLRYDICQWDGSDFLSIGMSHYVMEDGERILKKSIGASTYVTGHAMKIMKKAKITSPQYFPIEDSWTIVGDD